MHHRQQKWVKYLRFVACKAHLLLLGQLRWVTVEQAWANVWLLRLLPKKKQQLLLLAQAVASESYAQQPRNTSSSMHVCL